MEKEQMLHVLRVSLDVVNRVIMTKEYHYSATGGSRVSLDRNIANRAEILRKIAALEKEIREVNNG